MSYRKLFPMLLTGKWVGDACLRWVLSRAGVRAVDALFSCLRAGRVVPQGMTVPSVICWCDAALGLGTPLSSAFLVILPVSCSWKSEEILLCSFVRAECLFIILFKRQLKVSPHPGGFWGCSYMQHVVFMQMWCSYYKNLAVNEFLKLLNLFWGVHTNTITVSSALK